MFVIRTDTNTNTNGKLVKLDNWHWLHNIAHKIKSLWKWTWLPWKIIFKMEHCVWSTSAGLPEDQIASSVRVWLLASLSITSTKYWYLHCTCEHDLLVSWSSAPCWWKWSSLEPLLSLLVFTIIFLQQFEIQSHGNLPLLRAWFILQFSGMN